MTVHDYANEKGGRTLILTDEKGTEVDRQDLSEFGYQVYVDACTLTDAVTVFNDFKQMPWVEDV